MTNAAPRLTQNIARIAWPIALGRLGIMGMGVVDTIMVGQLAPDELAWQALGWAPTGVFLVAGVGLLIGVQVLTARLIGEGRRGAAGQVLRLGVGLALGAGLLAAGLVWTFGEVLLQGLGIAPELVGPSARVMTVLAFSIPLHMGFVAGSYFLEALQRPMAATVIMWAANGVNFALNAWQIPLYGAEGSAWATVGARLFLFMAVMAWIWRLPDAGALGVRRGAGASVGGVGLAALLQVGVAAAVSQAAEAGAFQAMTIFAARVGAQVVATYAILINIVALAFMIAMGIAGATAVLVAEAIGAKQRGLAARAAWTGLGLTCLTMVVLGFFIVAGGGAIARGFTSDPALVGLVGGAMVWVGLILLPDGAQVTMASALRARGDNWAPTASHVLAYVVVMPLIAFWLTEVHGQGVHGLMAAIFWSSVVSIAVLAARHEVLVRRG